MIHHSTNEEDKKEEEEKGEWEEAQKLITFSHFGLPIVGFQFVCVCVCVCVCESGLLFVCCRLVVVWCWRKNKSPWDLLNFFGGLVVVWWWRWRTLIFERLLFEFVWCFEVCILWNRIWTSFLEFFKLCFFFCWVCRWRIFNLWGYCCCCCCCCCCWVLLKNLQSLRLLLLLLLLGVEE